MATSLKMGFNYAFGVCTKIERSLVNKNRVFCSDIIVIYIHPICVINIHDLD